MREITRGIDIYYLFFLQAEYFRETVLRIEGDNVSAIDVAHHLETLRGNVLLRKEEKYLHPDTEAEMKRLTEEGNYVP